MAALLREAREAFHAAILGDVLRVDGKGVPSNADRASRQSKELALGIVGRIGESSQGARLAGQMAGNKFEVICAQFLRETFPMLTHMRPGKWTVEQASSGSTRGISSFEQYAHLTALETAAKADPELAAALGSDYTIRPDVVVYRAPETDETINKQNKLVDGAIARHASVRGENNTLPILHASISCKWTIRSDRAQNSRAEALNLIRNRKGRLPHIAVITAEPMPGRLASIALGTGDIDCVYHFALEELVGTVEQSSYQDARMLLKTMIDGRRLRDIADLPLDLVS